MNNTQFLEHVLNSPTCTERACHEVASRELAALQQRITKLEEALARIYDDVIQRAIPNRDDAWYEAARALLAEKE